MANKLTPKELGKISKSHLDISVAIGRKIGIIEKDKEYDYMSPTDASEFLISLIYDGSFSDFANYKHYIENKHSKNLLNFLRSKDDSLILQITSLLYAFITSEAVDPGVLHYSRLFPIGKNKHQLAPENKSDSDEEVKVIDGLSKLKIGDSQKTADEPSRDIAAYEQMIINSYDEPKYDHDIV